MLSNDSLPQPGRFLNQIVMECVGEALEVIGHRMNQGDNVGKRFLPSHQGKALSVLQGPSQVFDIESGPATSLLVRYPETIVGHKDGSVSVHTTSTHCHLFSTPPLLGAGSPIVALDQVNVVPTPIHGQSQLFLAASNKQLALFTFATRTESGNSRGESPETMSRRESSAGSVAESGGSGQVHPPTFVPLGTVSAGILGNRKIVRVTLSKCGTFAAVVFDTNEVAVVKFNGINAVNLARSQVEPILALESCTFPTQFRTESLPVIPQTAFLCHTVPPSLGYYKEHQQCRPLSHTLVVGWVGQNVFTTISLKDFGTAVEKAYAQAKEQANAAPAEVTLEQQAKPTKEKGASKEKGGGKGGAPAQATEALTVPLPPTDPLPERIRHKLLPQILSAMTANEQADAVGFGCFDGIIHVWKPSVGTIHSFHEARYRAHRNNVNVMMVTSLNFVRTSEGKDLLSAAISVPKIEHHSKVVVYDLKEDKAISTLPFVSGWTIVIPLPDLPLFVLYGSGKWYIGDLLNPGTMVCEFSGVPSPLAIPTGSNSMEQMLDFTVGLKDTMCVFHDMVAFGLWPGGLGKSSMSDVPDTKKGRTPTPTGRSTSATPTGDAPKDGPPTPVPGMLQLQYLCAADAVLEGYPMIKKQFGGCSIFQLGHVLQQVGPPNRDDSEALARVQLPSLGGFFGGAQSLTHGGLGASQASFKSNDKKGTNVGGTTGTGTSFRGSFRGSVAPNTATLQAKPAPVGANYMELIRYNIDQREAGRSVRQQQFKQQWEMLKQHAS